MKGTDKTSKQEPINKHGWKSITNIRKLRLIQTIILDRNEKNSKVKQYQFLKLQTQCKINYNCIFL